ncbi:hypothetical protein [Segetibacter koreensis]|uniref:hypothetical protein n=1 Tax=Segetibacter koreensis TaxID=398037 RepID=UPI00037A71DE|nr:hypothetical protein [Segetibacter koreensis]
MKKLFISGLLAVTVALSSFAAEGNKVSYTVLNNFQSEFKHVSDVQWTAGDNYTKATFVLNNVRTEALYSANGDLIGTNQAITLDELPVNAKRTFAKKYNGYTVKEAIRFEGAQESAYYISAENEKGSVVLKVADNGSISTVKN